MGRGSKGGCRSTSHQQFKEKAKTRVDDLQGVFTDLQSARKESRIGDVSVLEEQVNQMLREWKAELNDPSPACSLLGNSHVSSDLSSEIQRLLQLYEEQDDATSKLAELPPLSPKTKPLEAPGQGAGNLHDGGGTNVYQEMGVSLGRRFHSSCHTMCGLLALPYVGEYKKTTTGQRRGRERERTNYWGLHLRSPQGAPHNEATYEEQ